MEYVGTKKKQGSVVEILRDAILSGDIPNGTEMTQNELAESLGVSRMPVREALILLEYQGLIERLPNNHVRVAQLTEDYFHHIFRHCAELELEVLEWRQNQEERLSDERSEAELPEEELAFHRALRDGHPYSFSKKILETMTEIYIVFAVKSRKAGDRTPDLIREIRQALKKGKREEESRILKIYFDRLAETVVQARRKER